MSFLDDLDAAAGATTCDILDHGGGALIGAGAVSLVAGGTGLVPLSLGGLALLTKNLLCEPGWDPNKPQDGAAPGIDCSKASDGSPFSVYWIENVPFSRTLILQNVVEIVSIVPTPGQPEGSTQHNVNALRADGSADVGQFFAGPNTELSTTIPEGMCGGPPVGPPWIPPAPTDWTSPETNCTYNIAFQSWGSLPTGEVQPIYKISPGGTRSSGGVISGCNFSPVIYMKGPPGGPPNVGPWDDDWDDWLPGGDDGPPPWKPLLDGILQGVAAAGTQALLKSLFDTPYPGGTREIYAACDLNENGERDTFSVTFPEEKYQDRVLTALNAIVDFQQQILLWKTPICGPSSDKPDLFLHWRSITFESDDYTETGNRRLTKRLRYRGSSPGDVKQLAEHWRDFEWDTGGVIVYHKGSPVGTPQVWAASVDEGKRVLRHAFGEAGINPDQVGEWGTSSSDNPRYGVSRRVKLKVIDGCWMATARSGPSGWPQAAVCSPSP